MSKVKLTNNEVFTPVEYIDNLHRKFGVIDGAIVDNCCGEGVWLKYAQDQGYKVFGTDISEENCIKTIVLLYGPGDVKLVDKDKGIFTHNGQMVNNIVCADALRYHYRFDGTDPYETDEDQHFDSLFTIG